MFLGSLFCNKEICNDVASISESHLLAYCIKFFFVYLQNIIHKDTHRSHNVIFDLSSVSEKSVERSQLALKLWPKLFRNC